MHMRDLTALLMGDPGSSIRRAPTEEERAKFRHVPQLFERAKLNQHWLDSLLKRPVGFIHPDLSPYAAIKARTFCKAKGVNYRVWQQPGVRRLYSIERVK